MGEESEIEMDMAAEEGMMKIDEVEVMMDMVRK